MPPLLGANEKRSGYFEGSGYLVSWCIGHLISLADAATYNEQYRKWKYDDLPIVPQDWQFTVASGKEQQFSVLKDLMHRSDVSEIVNACDSGREGELIFRFVYEQANCKKPFSRLWISSMEESAIREGFSNLKDGRSYDNLYQSALCRAKADWLVGINATRLFSILYHKTLNVGRVQTPTLTMLVNRDYAISSFKKEKYHVVRLDAGGVSALSERLNDEAAAQQMKAACEKSQAVCTSLKKEKKTVAPPKLFDLTALQREANRLYGFTAKQTLDYAQALYEKRLLTYPRTDSKYITSDMQRQHKGTHYRALFAASLYAGREAASRPYKGLRQQQSNRPPRYFADSRVFENGLFFPYRQRNKTYDPCMREAALRRSRAL